MTIRSNVLLAIALATVAPVLTTGCSAAPGSEGEGSSEEALGKGVDPGDPLPGRTPTLQVVCSYGGSLGSDPRDKNVQNFQARLAGLGCGDRYAVRAASGGGGGFGNQWPRHHRGPSLGALGFLYSPGAFLHA